MKPLPEPPNDIPAVLVHRCPVHKSFVCMSIDFVGEGGTRVLGGKCCHRMYEETLGWWRLNQRSRDEIVEAMDSVLERAGDPDGTD